ncbi:hypothetical protein [Maricaulis alexandrii]|uniref:hypothetical protein n=1 Tax=Maricaulis alexandrii TaxID=2570354 RepID=UPI001108FA63|nr:hypothetical protein [Maricaulis alexandrii]
MSSYETGDDEHFAILVSELSDEQWRYAIRLCPYHKTVGFIHNLEFLYEAMERSLVDLSSARSAMAASMIFLDTTRPLYEASQLQAATYFLNFTSLYATYLDVCRRVRKVAGLSESVAYNKAVFRLIGRNKGKHAFVRDCRNYQLHYEVIKPSVQVSWGNDKNELLYIDNNEVLYSGWDWKAESRNFLQSCDKTDLLDVTEKVLRDIKRSVSFHRRISERWLRGEKNAYESYLRQRDRYKYLESSQVDIGAIFKRKSILFQKLIDRNLLNDLYKSSLSNDEVKLLIEKIVDRHKNLPAKTKKKLSSEIDKFLANRSERPVLGAYLQGRRVD